MARDFQFQQRDKKMIESPSEWPRWPLLPLVANDGRAGAITPDYPSTVIHLNVFLVNGVRLAVAQLDNDGDVPGVKTTCYQDVDAMLDDGWRVD